MKIIVALYVVAGIAVVGAAWIRSGGVGALIMVAIFALVAVVGVAIRKGIDGEN